MKRQNFCVVITGMPGVGKTTLAKNILNQYANAYPNRKIFVCDESNNFSFTKKQWYKINKPETLKKEMVSNGILIIDDLRSFDTSNDGKLLQYISRMRRHKNLDIIFVYHSIYDVHPKIWTFCNFLLSFKTTDSYKKIKQRVPFITEFQVQSIANLPKFQHVKIKIY